MLKFRSLPALAVFTALIASAVPASAQLPVVIGSDRAAGTGFRVRSVDVRAEIEDQVAVVQMAQTFQNTSSRTLETQFLFPLPADAAISELTLIVDGKELPGELKPKGQARAEYEAIVRRQRDPALLEYINDGLFRTSVFPVPAGQSRRVEIRYTQLLTKESGLTDFTLPLGTMRHSRKSIDDVTVEIRIRSDSGVQNLYSPTHDVQITQKDGKRAVCRVRLQDVTDPDDLRLLYGRGGDEVGISLVTYRADDEEQGYFMLLADPPSHAPDAETQPKTVLFVVDRSGSMAGEKILQAKASLRYMINRLGPKDTFNIIAYSSETTMFRPETEEVTRKSVREALEFTEDIYSGGGTNIHDALTAAMAQLQDRKRPSYVLFFTDGLPTVGETSETAIASATADANAVGARVFCFGLGYDVNSRLLDRISRQERGTSTYVRPDEDIEVAATGFYDKVSSPAMTGLQLKFSAADGGRRDRLVNRRYPEALPDLFRGEQLIVVGRYRRPADVRITLTGTVADEQRSLTVRSRFGDRKETRRNRFVETIWATRRIGEIVDLLDLEGHNQELVDELVSLSLRHGIMTPWTSFLADENQSLSRPELLTTEARNRTLSLNTASGLEGFSQRRMKSELKAADKATAPASRLSRGGGSPISGGFGGLGGGGRGRARAAGGLGGGGSIGSPAAPVGRLPGGGGSGAGAADEAKSAPEERVRRIGARTFYWKNDEWQDSEFAALSEEQQKEVVDVDRFSTEYFRLASLEDGKYAGCLSEPAAIVIRINEVNYRIAAATGQ